MHPSVERVAAALRAGAAAGEPRELDSSTRTAADAAAALGCPVAAIVKSLVFLAEGAPLLVLTSGAHQVDTAKVAATLGVAALERADADTVRRATGFPVGGVAPVGLAEPLPALVDVTLAGYPVLWAAAGTPRSVFPTTYDELVRLTAGRPAEVT